MAEPEPGSNRLQKSFLLLLLAAATVVFFRMIWGFLVPLLLAAVFAGMAFPLFSRLTRLTRGRQGPAAALTLAVVALVVMLPLAAFLGIAVDQAREVTASVAPWVAEQQARGDLLDRLTARLPERLREHVPEAAQVKAKVADLAQRVGAFVVNSLGALTRGTATFFLHGFVLLYAMYFFLVGGRQTLDRLLHLLPLSPQQESLLLQRFMSVSRATIKGTLLVGIIQGALGGIGFLLVGLGSAAFWGTVMAVLSIIPAVGAALVWVPAVGYLVAVGSVGKGIVLLLWCVLVVSSSDNVLRPRLVGRDAKMPDLLILVATLGGLTMFGAAGVVLGPVVAALFLTLWDMYGEMFRGELETAGAPEPAGAAQPASAQPTPAPLRADGDLPPGEGP